MNVKNVVFMGTPDFAVPAFNALIKSQHKVVAVYTAPPKPAGRGKGLRKTKIHELAEISGLPVFTPQSLKNEQLPECDVAVVAAYGMLLPKRILSAPKFGCINIHPSLLPRWRGAAPIQRTVMAGDEETAVCIMQMDEGLDTGDVLLMQKFALPPKITAGELHDKGAEIGAGLMLKAVDEIEELKGVEQTMDGVIYARKITREDERINWANPAKIIERQVRGLNSFPGAYFEYNGERIKVFKAQIIEERGEVGKVLDDKLLVACGDLSLRLLQMQRPGKRVLEAEEILRGFNIPKGAKL